MNEVPLRSNAENYDALKIVREMEVKAIEDWLKDKPKCELYFDNEHDGEAIGTKCRNVASKQVNNLNVCSYHYDQITIPNYNELRNKRIKMLWRNFKRLSRAAKDVA